MPSMKDTRAFIASTYSEYIRLVLPIRVLEKILAEDGVINGDVLAGKQHRGLLTEHDVRTSIELFCPSGFNVNFFISSLEAHGFPRAPLRDYLSKIRVPPQPAIIGWYLQHWRGRQQVQVVMEQMKGSFGYYEEFDWDEFGLGVIIA